MRTRQKTMLVGLIAGGLSFSFNVGQAQSRISFDEALQVTRTKSHVLKQSNYLEKQKEQEMKAARGLYFPNLSLNADYLQMSDDIHLDLTPVRDAITPLYQALSNYGKFSGVPNPDPKTASVMPILPDDVSTAAIRGKLKEGLQQINSAEWDKIIQKKGFATVSAGVTWPLYTGGKIDAANKAAKFKVDEAKQTDRQKQGELTSELAERYYGLCLAKQALMVRQEVLKGMESHLTDAEKMQKQGMLANAEVLHAKVFYTQADRELKKSQRDIEIINQALINTMSLEDNQEIEPSSPLFYLADIESSDYFKQLALKNNPLLSQVAIKKELAHQGARAETANYFPTLAVIGTYDIVNKDLSPYMPDWMVGVGLRWTVFDGASRSKKVKAAQYVEDQVREAELKAKDDIRTVIEKLHQELMMDVEQLHQLETSYQFAEEYLRVREKAFREGMSNSTEVVDARLNLAKVKMERLQVAYQFDVALAKILEFSGISEQYVAYQNRAGAVQTSYTFN
ncbi:MAG: TolC family protein [Bacteroidota bacterium]|nr:TolC family protein [Bacteroidota bacterium]MDP4204798.1 TolC family protein [Bacteroidota bacterium]